MSFRRNLKVALAAKVAEAERENARVEAAFAVLVAAGNPDHCGPGGGGGRFTDKEHATCENPGAVQGDVNPPSAANARGIPGIPAGGFPASEFDAKKGKPIPGTDAWLHAHGISKDVWNDRPYVRFEEGQTIGDLPAKVQALYEGEPEASRQVTNMMNQTGGLIMVRSAVPGVSAGQEKVVPQTRPDVPVISDHGAHAYREKVWNSAKDRTKMMEALTPAGLVDLQQGRVENAKNSLETAKVMDRAKFLEYASGRDAAATSALADFESGLPKRGRGVDKKALAKMAEEQRTAEDAAGVSVEDRKPTAEETLDSLRTEKRRSEKGLEDANQRADYNFGTVARATSDIKKENKKSGAVMSDAEIAAEADKRVADQTARFRESETNNATKRLANAEKKLVKIQGMDDAGKKEQIGKEIETAKDVEAAAKNAFDKTSAKYLFPPNPGHLIDAIEKGEILGKAGRVNAHEAQNIKNLLDTKTNGRVYLAMEGNIKEDSLLSAVASEQEKGASVISVPSVTLWRHSEMAAVAKKYLSDGREVVLIPDADGVNNPRVRNEARAMQALLESGYTDKNGVEHKGAKVSVAPPPIPLKDGKPVLIPRVDRAGKPILDANGKPSLSNKVQEFETVIPGSPKGTIEQLKGADDYLGLGGDAPAHPITGERPKGTLGNLAIQRREVPDINLHTTTVTPQAIPNAEKALRAISLMAGPEGAARIGTGMLGAAMGVFNPHVKTPQRALGYLEDAGLIQRIHIFDENGLSRGLRLPHKDIQNPDGTVNEKLISELVKAKVIDKPAFGDDDTRPVEWGYEEVPIIRINEKYKAKDSSPVPLNTLAHDTSPGRIRSLHSSGKTYQQIEDILGISSSTISDALK